MLGKGKDDLVALEPNTGIPMDPWKTDGFANIGVELAYDIACGEALSVSSDTMSRIKQKERGKNTQDSKVQTLIVQLTRLLEGVPVDLGMTKRLTDIGVKFTQEVT